MNTPYEQRLARIEADIASIKALLGERCEARGDTLKKHSNRLHALEVESQRRKGGAAVLTAVCTGAGVAGGILVRLFQP